MAYDFKGKVAFITGGAQGIGLAIVKELLRNGVQAVTVTDINAEKGAEAVKELTQEFGPNRAIFIKTDVSKADQLEAAFKKTIDTWNAVDIVINNAGFAREEQWELEISVNCNAVVHGNLLGLQHMGKDKGGKGGVIVNTASNTALVAFPFLPIYAATKHFVIGLGRSLGDPYHYNRTGVRILTICPGGTDTGIVSESTESSIKMWPEAGRDLAKLVSTAYMQPAEIVGQGVVTLIKEGETGDVWLAENGKPAWKVQLPTAGGLEDQWKNLTSK